MMDAPTNSNSSDNVATFMMPELLGNQIDEIDYALANGKSSLILDFTNCQRISVEGLEWLEELLLRADSSSASVRLEKAKPSIYKVFKVARIESLMRACGLAGSGSKSQANMPQGPVC
jgi:hypothetical protein